MPQIINADCFEQFSLIANSSLDAVITDPPYAETQNKWDVAIDLVTMFQEFKRMLKPNGLVVSFCSFKFGAKLLNASCIPFKYDLVWRKKNSTGFLDANRKQLRVHELILVFYDKQPTYNPQKTEGKPYKCKNGNYTSNYNDYTTGVITDNKGDRFPTSVIELANKLKRQHPTQKPLDLMEYLVKTYTNEGDLVLDPFAGVGSTLIACKNLNRDYIGIEKDPNYFELLTNNLTL